MVHSLKAPMGNGYEPVLLSTEFCENHDGSPRSAQFGRYQRTELAFARNPPDPLTLGSYEYSVCLLERTSTESKREGYRCGETPEVPCFGALWVRG